MIIFNLIYRLMMIKWPGFGLNCEICMPTKYSYSIQLDMPVFSSEERVRLEIHIWETAPMGCSESIQAKCNAKGEKTKVLRITQETWQMPKEAGEKTGVFFTHVRDKFPRVNNYTKLRLGIK